VAHAAVDEMTLAAGSNTATVGEGEEEMTYRLEAPATSICDTVVESMAEALATLRAVSVAPSYAHMRPALAM
jgi:hypothetical protein